jgi:hypothetical protein
VEVVKMKGAILLMMLLLCVGMVSAVEYTVEYPDNVEEGQIFWVEHKFFGLEPGDEIIVNEFFNEGMRMSAWEAKGSNRTLQEINKTEERADWKFVTTSDSFILVIHYLASSKVMEYPYHSIVSYPGDTVENQGIIEVLHQETSCIGEMVKCEDNTIIMTKECVDGVLVDTGKTCPEEQDISIYWKVLASFFIGFMIALVVVKIKQRNKEKDTKTSQ